MANIKDHVSVLKASQDLLPGGEGQDFWPPHHITHEDGGSDVINVNNLLGTLADPQNAGWIQGIPVPADTVTPSDGDTLVYSQGSGEWVYGPPIPGASIWARDNGAGFLYPVTSTDRLRMGSGSAGAPAYAFLSAGDSGLFWDGHPALSLAGLKVWRFEHLSNALTMTSNYRTRIIAQHDGAVANSAAVAELVALSSSSGNNARSTMYAEHTSGWGQIDIHSISGGLSSSSVDIWSAAQGTDTSSYITLGGQANGSGLRYLRLGGSIGESSMLFDSIRFGTRSLDSAPGWTVNYLEFCEPGNTTQWTEYRANFGQVSLIQAVNLAYAIGGGGVIRTTDTTDNTIARWDGDNVNSIQGSGISISDSNEMSGVRFLGLNSTPGSVAHTEGRLFYDNEYHTLAVYTDQPDVTLQVGQEEYIRVYNNTASTISNGAAVYISGAFNGYPTVALARSDSPSTAYAAGLATHDISAGQSGFVTMRGGVTMDTSTFSLGDFLYVSATTAGALTNTAPEGGNLNVVMGFVYTVGTSGRVQVRRVSIPVKSDKTFLLPGNIITSTNGSTLTNPRTIGATDFSTGEAMRYQFGDVNSGIQNGYDQAVQFWAYHPMIFLGNRATAGAPTMETLSNIGTLFRGTQAASVVMGIQAAASQTANLLEFRNNTGTALSRFLYNGNLDLNTASIVDNAVRLVQYSTDTLFIGQDTGGDTTPNIDLEAGAQTNFSIAGNDLFRVQSIGLNALNHDFYAAKTITFNQWPTITVSGGAATVDFTSYQKATVSLNNAATVDITINAPAGPGNFMIELLQGSTTATTTINWVTQGTVPLDEPVNGLLYNSDLSGRTAVGLYYTGSRWGIVGTPMQQLLAS